MSPERWHRVKTLFDEAQRRTPDKRAAFLGEACAGDVDLRAEVERLLVAESEADTFFDGLGRAVMGSGAEKTDPVEADAPPFERAGPYRLLHLVGRGGMGAVYLAERADGAFQRNVAVKLIRRGVTSDEAALRFRVERQALAALRHPSIARLLDGGVLVDGLPYLAMEYVEGVPVTDYCDHHHLGVEARLRLFLDVCDAVEHAHRRLIVHRDLKPSNVLVTEDDAGAPRPVLLDFGLAKLLDAEPGVTVPLTQVGHQALTPHYAAPEQFSGGEITTATDVYALGVLLYELLSGHRPHAVGSVQAIAEAVREQPPARPSTVVMRSRDRRDTGGETRTVTPEEVSAARTSTPHRLQRRLRGDLDRIVLKALRKEPEQRYISAEALAEDLRRHLGGLPVMARPHTAGYRFRSFVRRHRVGVAASTLVFIALIGGLGAALWQANRAEAEAERARTEAETSEAVTAFLIDVLMAPDPSVAQGDTLNARQLLDRGAARVSAEFEDRPLLRARMLDVIGRVYLRLGLLERGAPLIEQGARLREEHGLPGSPDMAVGLEAVAALLRDRGEYVRADSLMREAIELWQIAEAPDTIALASAFMMRSYLLRTLGDYDAAEGAAREAVSLQEALGARGEEALTEALYNLAVTLKYQRRYDEATAAHARSLALSRELFQPTHPAIAANLAGLGNVLKNSERDAEAETYLREAADLFRQTYGPDHVEYSTTLLNLASALMGQDRYAEAEAMYRDALRIREAALGVGHPYTDVVLYQLGNVEYVFGRLDEAERLFQRVLRMREETLGLEHPYTARTLYQLARVAHAKEHDVEAERYLERARQIEPDSVAPVRWLLVASVAQQRGAHARADSVLRLAEQQIGDGIQPGSRQEINLWKARARLALAQAQFEDAADAARRAAALAESHAEPGFGVRADAQRLLGEALVGQRRFAEAEPLLLGAHATFEAPGGEGAAFATQREAVNSALADLYRAWERPKRAAAYREGED